MAGPEQTTLNDSYAQWRRIFWLMLMLLGAVSGLLVWNAHVRNSHAQTLQSSIVQGAVRGAAHEINLHVQALRMAVRLFAEKERVLLQRLASDPDSVASYQQLLKDARVYFNDALAVALADERGNPVVADFDGFVGPACLADLHTVVQSEFATLPVYIHPNSHGYHFDIMTPVDLGARQPHIFFISFYPRMIASILQRYQLTGHQLLLLNREIDELVEVDVQGARDTMSRGHFINAAERERMLYSASVENTRWRVADFSEISQTRNLGHAVWQETAVAITSLTLLSMYFLYTLRLHMRRIDVQNATLRAQAQEIQERSAQVINILERTTDAYIEFDEHWHCTYLNRQAGELLDQAPELVIGKGLSEAFPELAAAFYNDMQKARTEGVAQVFSGFYPPSQRWLEMHVHPMPERMTVFMRDITRERVAWEQAKDNAARIRELARLPDESPAPVLRVDANGLISYANRPAELLLRCWDTSVDSDVPSKIAALVREALNAAGPIEREVVCLERVFLVRFAPVAEGNYVNLYGEDITERKRAEQELKNHRDNLEALVGERTTALVMAHNDALVASRAKSAFLASMSHELRTPLNAIIGYGEMLEDSAADAGNDSLRADLRKIIASGRNLLSLINDILDLSKIEAGKVQFSLEQFEVEQMLRDLEITIRPLVMKNQNRFDMVVDGELGTMYSDVVRVKQVLLNLLSNACKFTTRGRITLMVRREILPSGASLSFIVNDTGIGMTSEQVSRLFEPFMQANRAIAIKYGGTGLGLALSRRLCELMGGDIRVHSDAGVGSSFTVVLPAATVAQVEAGVSAVPS